MPRPIPKQVGGGASVRWWREASGAVADLGVLLPLALALIALNGLSATAVFLGAGLGYLAVAAVFRVPVAVQPVKVFAAVAIATGADAHTIAAGAILLGVVFGAFAATGLLGALARVVPVAVVRGVQAAVGVKLGIVAYGLIADPPELFANQLGVLPGAAVAVALLVVLLVVRKGVALAVVVAGGIAAVIVAIVLGMANGAAAAWGPTAIAVPELGWAVFGEAAVLLVFPQVALTATNACIAPADAAPRYFGDAARRVTPRNLGLSIGFANIGIGAMSGMPICHGAGGMSAHYLFGARTWRAPAIMGATLVFVALAAARPVEAVLPLFPLPVLAALLAAAGFAHIRLAFDVRGTQAITVAAGVAVLGVFGQLLVGVIVGTVIGRYVWEAKSRSMSTAGRSKSSSDSGTGSPKK